MQVSASVYIGIYSLLSCIASVLGLQCYNCQSNQPGCGKELNIRLQRWHTCPSPGPGGGENFCVKVIQKVGSDQIYTRECLMTLRHNTGIREQLPTVQRHGYCEPARNNDPWNPVNYNMIYCFCNDYNGCNTASGLQCSLTTSLFLGLFILVWQRWLS